MKIYLLSPVANEIFSSEVVSKFSGLGEVIIDSTPQPISQLPGMLSEEEKIIALDPDYCEWSLKKEEIDKLVNVKSICLQSTSFSWLDTGAASQKNIAVVNVRNYSTEAVAEWAFMMSLAIARKIPLIAKNAWVGDFSMHQGLELKGKTAGIIGLGNIGRRIAELCHGFGMKVVYWSKNSCDDRFSQVDLSVLFSESDVVFPCLAQNNETKNYITDDLLKSMKDSAIFVSIVHKIYNHELLLDLVRNGQIYGYAYETQDNSEMLKHEGNVWAGPEQAWTTKESLSRNLEIWTQNIINSASSDFRDRVN